MPLSDSELIYYDSNVLRLPAEKRTEYHAQVDRLVAELSRKLKDQNQITISKVVKAGSFAKYTILRKTSEDPVDVDVVIYIRDRNVDNETFASLSEIIYNLLVVQYPTKSVEDFTIQRKAATVQFVGTGLSVDIVPVIEDVAKLGFGWQFDSTNGTKVRTCAPCQIKFVADRKDQDKYFRTLVRLAKRWRNFAEIKPLKSFHIELIMAHVLAIYGRNASIEKRFRDFLMYIAQSGLKDFIHFPENGSVTNTFADPVVILDPVNSANNVTSRISETERKAIVQAALDAWEIANYASTENDIEVWKEIFGNRFKVKESS